MNNEYITKQQAISLIKQYEVLIGCTGVSVLTSGIKRMESVQQRKWRKSLEKRICCKATATKE